jgi:hypothetical protein
MGVFANVYIGNKFSGTLEIKSNITGKKESYKIIGFSRILTPKSKANKDKTDKNKDGSDKNKDGSDKNKDGSDKNKDGSDKNKDGSDKNKDGSDKNKDGSDKNKDTINSHDYHKEMSVGFAKYKTKVFGEQLWTVENMRLVFVGAVFVFVGAVFVFVRSIFVFVIPVFISLGF